jgi:hypothetical protein
VSTPPTDEISTMEAVALLGYNDRSTVVRMVREHRLTPSRKMPGATGAYLFWRHDVLRLAAEIAAKRDGSAA